MELIYRLPALLLAITVHEYAHGRVAYHFGDATAKWHGRLTLNPLRHLDPIGTITLLLFGFGWAKPVPVNPYNFRDYRSGMLWVSFAGPLANFALAFISMIFIFLPLRLGLYWTPYFQFM
ncbi:MAG: site-2 protease family protein, partial [Dethiobacteria bacterium]